MRPALAGFGPLVAALVVSAAGCASSSASSIPAADAGTTPADWECPTFPPGVTEFKAAEPPLTLTVSEANARMAELERYIWFDTPAGIERPEFANWGAKTKIPEVRCLRRRSGGFKSVYAAEDRIFSVPAESFASIGGSTFRFETPVVIRTGKRIYISMASASIDYSRTHVHAGGVPHQGPGHYAVERGRDFLTIELDSVLSDHPDNYRYLVDKDEDRWVEDTEDAIFVALPTRGEALDPSRPGYVFVIGGEHLLQVRTIHIVDG